MNPHLSRRTLLGAGPLLLARSARAADPATAAENAAIWGMTLVQTGRYLALSQARGVGFNRFHLNHTLATPASMLAAPNVDTIYGYGWLDVSKEPVLLDVPEAVDDRYYCVQFIDAYQNIVGYVGHRETGTRAGTYAVVGPGWSGTLPQDVARIPSPTTLVLTLTRTLVRGSADLAAAQAFQEHYTLAPLSAWPHGRVPPQVEAEALNAFPLLDLSGDGRAYFRELEALIKRFPPRGQEVQAFSQFASLGLGRDFSADHIDASALGRAIARVKRTDLGDDNEGWRVNYHIRRFNADPLARAAINRVGPGAHAAEEALYFAAKSDHAGAALSGTHRYRIVFAKGHLPPARAFWSLILYGADLRLVANRLDRYTINDRTENLTYAPDGTLAIVIARKDPKDGANWLPAPDGPFSLILRTYEPDETLRNGTYRMPAITRET